jgi:hypothetical protein
VSWSSESQEGGSALKRAWQLMASGLALLFLLALVINLIRGGSDQSDPLAAKILFSMLGLLSAGLLAAGGLTAWKGLSSRPLESITGRRSFALARVAIVLLPVIVFTLGLLAALDAYGGDSEPFLAVWLLVAIAASILGGVAPEPGRRGLLVIPLMLGVAAVVLLLSEILGIS